MPARHRFPAVLFDLDGTLVETEALKARSYAAAAAELCPGEVATVDVLAAYEEHVGRSREEIARALLERFHLEPAARARLAETGAAEPWEAFVAVRLRYYEAMLDDPALLREQEYRHATALLRRLRGEGHRIGVATMSHRTHAPRVLDALGLAGEVDVLVTRDEVEHPKPHPEIYLLAARRLGAAPGRCLAIEDSLPGVRSALAAGMACVAATTPLTRDLVHRARVLPPARIVDDHGRLAPVVSALLAEGAEG